MTIPKPPPGFTEDIPVPQVPPVAKIPAAPEGFTEDVDPTGQSYLGGLARTAIGQGMLMGWGDEAFARARQVLGEEYDKALADERAKVKGFAQTNPKMALAAELAGGFATPGLGLASGVIKPAATLGKRMLQSSALGAGAGALAGAGYGDEERLRGAAGGAIGGAGLGAVLPPAISGVGYVGNKIATNPRYAQFKADLANSTLGRLVSDERGSGALPGVTGATPPAAPPPGGVIPPSALDSMSPGAKAAAYQTIANYLASGNKSVEDLRKVVTDAVKSGKLHSSGQAQDVLALIDLDPSMAQAAGSAMRKNSEVQQMGTAFLKTRQTGIAQEGLPSSAGLPAREVGAPRITGKQADELHGTDYGAGQKNIVPMGQGERIEDMLKRSMLIKDVEHHGFGANAHLTDEMILARAQQEAQPAYNALYQAGNNHDVSSYVKPVADHWVSALENSRLPLDVRATLLKDVKMLLQPEGNNLTHIEAVDLAKRRLDDKIENALSGAGNKDKILAMYYTRIKQDLLKGVEVNGQRIGGIDNHPILGKLYETTRDKWSSAMEDREMIQLGRDLFAGKAPASAIDAVASNDRLKLVREGYVGAYRDKSANTPRTHDRTKWFDNERQEEILTKLVPASEASGAPFADKPQRVGRYLGNEKRMVDSNYEVTGNSKTAQRMADDMKFDQVSKVSSAIEQWKSGGSISNIGFRVVQNILEKHLGMPAESAKALGHMMFTADKNQLAVVLSEVEKRMGKSRFEQFSRLMQQAQAAFTPGATTNIVGSAQAAP